MYELARGRPGQELVAVVPHERPPPLTVPRQEVFRAAAGPKIAHRNAEERGGLSLGQLARRRRRCRRLQFPRGPEELEHQLAGHRNHCPRGERFSKGPEVLAQICHGMAGLHPDPPEFKT